MIFNHTSNDSTLVVSLNDLANATFKGNNDDDVLVIDNSQVSINRLLITQNINSYNLITRLIENDNTIRYKNRWRLFS